MRLKVLKTELCQASGHNAAVAHGGKAVAPVFI